MNSEWKEGKDMIGVLLIHGFTGGPHELAPLTERLKVKTDWLVKVPTLPGHGLDLNLSPHTHQEWIETVETAYHGLKQRVDTIYIVGFSMGGMLAGYLAGKYGADKLVMLSPSRKYLNLIKLTKEVTQLVKDRIVGELEENFTYKHYHHKQGKIPLKAYLEFVKCVKVTEPYLKEITNPTLVLQGMEDGLVPYQTTHALDKDIPIDIDVIYYLDSKHMICLGDDQEVVVGSVIDYLMKPAHKKETTDTPLT
jgi:esterase/lipase